MYLKDTDTWGVPLPCRFFSRLRACVPRFLYGPSYRGPSKCSLIWSFRHQMGSHLDPKKVKKKRSCAKFIKFITSIFNIPSKRLSMYESNPGSWKVSWFYSADQVPSACHGGMAPRSASKRRVRGGGSATDYRGCVTFSSICSLGSLVMRLFLYITCWKKPEHMNDPFIHHGVEKWVVVHCSLSSFSRHRSSRSYYPGGVHRFVLLGQCRCAARDATAAQVGADQPGGACSAGKGYAESGPANRWPRGSARSGGCERDHPSDKHKCSDHGIGTGEV